MAGLQRDGLRASEVFQIRKTLEALLNDGEEPDVAYSLACRGVTGVSAETFKGWKPDIFKLVKGEPTPADALLSGALVPATATPANGALFKRVADLGAQLDTAKTDHARVLQENEELKAQLAGIGKKK